MYKIEILKLLKRKDILILASMLIIPIFYSVGAFLELSLITYNSSNKEYALKFVVSMFEFVYLISIYMFILSICSAQSLAGEISNKSILYYMQRVNDRKKIYKAKKIALITIFSTICILFVLLTIVLFYLFLIHRKDIAIPIFFIQEELIYLIIRFLIIYLFYITIISYCLFLSSFLKKNHVVIMSALSIVICMYLQYIPILKYLSPTYYITEISNVTQYDGNILNIVVMSILVNIIYNIVFDTSGIKKLNERDLS